MDPWLNIRLSAADEALVATEAAIRRALAAKGYEALSVTIKRDYGGTWLAMVRVENGKPFGSAAGGDFACSRHDMRHATDAVSDLLGQIASIQHRDANAAWFEMASAAE